MEPEEPGIRSETTEGGDQGTPLGGALFATAIAVVLVIAGVMARDFPASVARLPTLLVLLALAPAIVLAARDWALVWRGRHARAASLLADNTVASNEGRAVRRRIAVIAALMVAQLVLLKLTGLTPSIGLFLIASMSVLAVSFKRTVLVTAGMLLVLNVLFGLLLRMPMFEGLLTG